MNDRDKQMHNPAIENPLNTELIQDNPIFFKFMRSHKNEEYQAVSLSK